MLIKKQKDRKYLTLYLSDCGKSFWIEKIDVAYCYKLKTQLDVTGNFDIFLNILAQGLKAKVNLRNVTSNPVIEISS